MTMLALDVRAMPDEELLSLYRSDEQAAAAVLAEAARRDRTDRAARQRARLRAEWYDAAYAQYLEAENVTCGNLLSREGLAAGIADPFSLWHGRADVAARYGSEELNQFWAASPRVTVSEYLRQIAVAHRAAREDTDITTDEGITDEQHDMDADRRPGLAADDAGAVRPGGGAGAGQPVRSDRGAREAGAGTADGPVQRGGQVMGVLEGARVAEHLARGAMRAAERQQQARQRLEAARGAVAVRQPQTVVIPRQPIDGAKLLTDTSTMLNHFAVWPNEAALTTATLWACAAHAKDEKTGLPVWQYSPRVFFTSAQGGSGKSWMARLVAKLSPDGKMFVEATKASLVRLIAKQATVVVTELDVLVGQGGRSRWFTGIANAGYERDQATYRVDHGKELEIPLMCPMILDGLETVITATGVEMKTLMSRCIIIHVKRAPDGYRAPRFDDRARAVFAYANEKLGEWMAQQVRAGIADVVPELPEGLGNRPGSLWEPLLAVADAAGGDWPQRARQALADLESPDLDEDDDREADYRAALSSWAVDGPDDLDEDA